MERIQLISIKRVAMETAFFCAVPYDYDHGFDRLMVCKTAEDLKSTVFGDIFLHTFLQEKEVGEVKKFVLKKAIQLVAITEHVSWEVAETLLLQVSTNEPPPSIGAYLKMGKIGMLHVNW
ncbi:hypothetical protein [Serratia fonticola]|uniref:hypothetical protein n=2 Tax=Serratia TaxID=613 RepID=UPI000EF48E4A|nr:hypothetical protein [Serratia fonticola]AYM93029.1 hypothetical protein D9980_22045 [Serratia sp. 3ACOL1]MBL5904903.1 hypothetical protein [Serratia fonticola]